MGEHLIKVENLTLSYENMTVVKDLSFTVEGGDYLCIVGENGSGKSTLVKSLLSLKKPVGGEITFGGGLRRNEIGYLPQQTGAQHDFPASVGEVVISGCLNSMGFRPFYTDRERKKAAENMERLSISDLKKRSFRELSGGQQQRCSIGRAIVKNPDILLCDEPTGALCATSKLLLLDEPVSGLDPMVTAEMYELIADINRSGVTVVMVTHDVSAALKYAGHILCMRQGLTRESWFFGTPEEFLTSSASDFLKGGAVNG